MAEEDRARRLLEELFYERISVRDVLLDLLVMEGVAFRHPDTGKWHDRSGLGFDTREDLVRHGDVFSIPDAPFKLR